MALSQNTIRPSSAQTLLQNSLRHLKKRLRKKEIKWGNHCKVFFSLCCCLIVLSTVYLILDTPKTAPHRKAYLSAMYTALVYRQWEGSLDCCFQLACVPVTWLPSVFMRKQQKRRILLTVKNATYLARNVHFILIFRQWINMILVCYYQDISGLVGK